jgi:hypothetical protein
MTAARTGKLDAVKTLLSHGATVTQEAARPDRAMGSRRRPSAVIRAHRRWSDIQATERWLTLCCLPPGAATLDARNR